METARANVRSIDSKLLARIRGRGRGAVVVPSDFLDLGSRQAVDVALHRFAKKGVVRRLARGLYDYPKEHPVLGTLAPSVDAIARALAGRDRTRIQPAGAYAANLLGLSEQVPAKAEFAAAQIQPGVAPLPPAVSVPLPGGCLQYLVDPATRSPVLLFHNPCDEPSGFDHLKRSVKLEFGSLTDQRSVGRHPIRPWIADILGGPTFDDWACEVVTLKVERTFWEKATILHAEFHRRAAN